MQLRHLLYSLVLLLLCPSPASAAVVDDLYQALVPVQDHSDAQLSEATRAGLAQVLVKVSGSRDIVGDPAVQEALDRARSLLQQYQYLRPDRDRLELAIQYDPQLVTDILSQALLPLWTADRPPVLVWLVVDDANGRQIAARDTHPQLFAAVEAAFQLRGVPVEFPLQDLQDTLAVGVRELWLLDSHAIYRASGRYHSEHVLVGRLRAIPDQRWMGDWLYLRQDESKSLTQYGEVLEDFVRAGVHLAADTMAARYALAPTGNIGDSVLVRVDGLLRYADYRASLELLQAVELVAGVVVEYAAGATVVFRVNARLEPGQLARVIGRKGRLQALHQFEPLDPVLPNPELVFQWIP